jgi:hypothetical protein
MKPGLQRLCLVHLVGNALLLWLGYGWLGVGEATLGSLAWSVLLAVAVVGLALWLHGSALAYFRTGAFLNPRNLPALLVVAAVALGIYVLLARWADYSAKPAFQIASYLTLKLRKPLKPATVLAIFNGVLWLVRWVVVPVLLLPIASQGFRKPERRWLYWLAVPVLLLCALKVPLAIVHWVPPVGGFGMQMASFLLRAAVAYLFFTGSLLLLAFFSSGGSPRLSQSKSVASP